MTIFDIMSSGWLIMEIDNWYLKDDTPKEIVKAFEKYQVEDTKAEKEGRIIY